MTEQSSWWEILKYPMAIISAPLSLKVVEWWYAWRKEKRERNLSAAERREAILLEDRKALSAEQREIYGRVEVERDRVIAEIGLLRTERRQIERDRDRGWALARHYWHMTIEMQHALSNARQIAESTTRRLKPAVPLPTWHAFLVPDDMEAPIPRDPSQS